MPMPTTFSTGISLLAASAGAERHGLRQVETSADHEGLAFATPRPNGEASVTRHGKTAALNRGLRWTNVG